AAPAFRQEGRGGLISLVGRYASRSLVTHLIMTLLGCVALLELLDLLNNSDDIIARHGNHIAALAKYAVLRLPYITSFTLPFTVLIAAQLMLAKFARDNEILALKASGLSFYRMLSTLVPVALAIGTLHFLLSDQIVPRTTRALANWDANATDIMGASTTAAPASGSTPTPAATPAAAAPGVWVRSGNSFIHSGAVLAEGGELRDMTIYERGTTSNLERRIMAKRAVYLAKHWTMADVEVLELGADQSRKPVNHAELP